MAKPIDDAQITLVAERLYGTYGSEFTSRLRDRLGRYLLLEGRTDDPTLTPLLESMLGGRMRRGDPLLEGSGNWRWGQTEGSEPIEEDEDDFGDEDDWELMEAEEDWSQEKGKRGGVYWVHKGTGRKVYSKTNPGAKKPRGAAKKDDGDPAKPGEAKPSRTKKNTAVDVDSLKRQFEAVLSGDDPADAESLAQSLMGLNQKQLRELKGRLETKVKEKRGNAALAKQLADAAVEQARAKRAAKPAEDEEGELDLLGGSDGEDLKAETAAAVQRRRREADVKGGQADRHFAALLGVDLGDSDLTRDKADLYRGAMEGVYARMPRHARDRVASNHKETRFASSRREMADRVADDFEADGLADLAEKYRGEHGDNLGGTRRTDTGVLYLDGGYDREDGPARVDREDFDDHRGDDAQRARSIYAHELTHAIDAGGEFSGGEDWQEIFGSELKGKDAESGLYRLSSYANTNPEEAFAEFGRLVYSGQASLAEVKKTFPKASAFFEENGLWPDDAGDEKKGGGEAARLDELFDPEARIDAGDAGHGDVLLAKRERPRPPISIGHEDLFDDADEDDDGPVSKRDLDRMDRQLAKSDHEERIKAHQARVARHEGEWDDEPDEEEEDEPPSAARRYVPPTKPGKPLPQQKPVTTPPPAAKSAATMPEPNKGEALHDYLARASGGRTLGGAQMKDLMAKHAARAK